MLLQKPHENRAQRPERNFLTEQLQFSEFQKEQFDDLDKEHKDIMVDIEKSIMKQKDVLFNSFQIDSFNVDSLTTKIGLLEAKKDSEVFIFFKKVRTLCTSEQEKIFDKIIEKALKGREEK